MGRADVSTIKAMVIDDSAVARQVLTAVLTSAAMEVRSAPDPIVALKKLESWDPDVLVLDLEMPRMDGITFLKHLRKTSDLPVVVCSAVTGSHTEKALLALHEGAAEVVTKPQTAVRDFLFESSVILVDAVTAAAESRPSIRARRLAKIAPSVVPSPHASVKKREIVTIGASTGGPEAIRGILAQFPRNAPPTLVVQHMPAGFTRAFANHLNQATQIEVREAVTGDLLQPGLALIAPGGRHVSTHRGARGLEVEVIVGPLVSRHRPSVDVMFDSVATCVGADALAVILTGMGDDGARGMQKLKEAGAYTIAQDEQSSVVYGMPHAAVELGAVNEIATLSDIPHAILKQCRIF